MSKKRFVPIVSKEYVFKSGKYVNQKLKDVIKENPGGVYYMVKCEFFKLDREAELSLIEYYKIKYNKDLSDCSDI
jgi:hypothetical protein